MAKMKVLPKALIVGALIGLTCFGVVKFLPKKAEVQVTQPADPTAMVTQAPVEQLAQTPAAVPDSVAQPPVQVAPPQLTPSDVKLPGTGIASGQKTGTNWPMVQDLTKVCSRDDNPLRNNISDGSLDNIYKIYGDKNTQYGVVQEDVLAYQAAIDPTMMNRVVVVFPFFSVEMHLVASNATAGTIRTLADLQGKRVVEGPQGSGTWVTVQLIKKLTGITWTPINLSQADGLKAVQTGQADVEFIVAGQPITLLRGAQDVRLISLNHPALDTYKFYTRTMLPTGSYPFQGQPVQTYKVNNVLATFAFKNQYQREIGELVTCITHHIGELQADGHPKWKDVDALDIDRVKWPVHPSAVAAIKREAKVRK